MATKADIIVRAIVADAKKKLDELAGSLRGVGETAKPVSAETGVLKEKWGALVASMQEAGSSFQEIAQFTGLTRDEFISLGYTVEELTGLVEKQGVELLRMPGYIMGYRGGWLNLIMTLGFGVSVFKVLHRTLERLWEPLEASSQRVKDFNENLRVFIPNVQEWAKQAREAERDTFNWGELLRATALEMVGFNEALDVDRIREHELAVKAASEAGQELSEAGLVISAKRFEEQRQQILETSGSAEEYRNRLLELLGITPELYAEIDKLTRSTFEFGTAAEYAAQQAAKLRERFERIMGVIDVMADIQEEAGQYTRDLADTHDAFADRVEDALFRAGQAWESFQFRMAQAVSAFNFRMMQTTARYQFRTSQMTARFQQRQGSAAARAAVASGAAAARLALSIQSITQDHYDRLEDMARKHQEELRRMLQRAPWYLQRTIRDYQRRRKDLEARGDKEGLARLKKNFIERIRTIDPIFAEELEHLEELQQDERNVEEREFRQRLHRARAQAAISRAQSASNAAIALADAEFAYQQQLDAAKFAYDQQVAAQEFAQQQRLDAMKFAYGQQAEASGRAYDEALEDYGDALEDRTREFKKWAKDETRRLYNWGRRHGKSYNRGLSETMTFPEAPAPSESPYAVPVPGRGYQRGLSYVPSTMPVVVHTGEAILRKDQAAAWRGERGGEIIINFYGPVYMRTRQEIRELTHEISRELGRQATLRR